MNKVLIICSNFLPLRNGGTIRSEKLVKYLPHFQWTPIILTKRTKKTYKSFDVINGINIYRSRKFDLASFLFKIKNKLSNTFLRRRPQKNVKNKAEETVVGSNTVKRRTSDYFLLPDADIFWALGALFKGSKVVMKEQPSVILSTGPSHSVHILGLLIKKIHNKKWVVEYRDPWTMNPFRIPKPFKILNYLDNYLEKNVLKKADIINVTSIEYKKELLKKYSFLRDEKIVNIPNGFDPEDFELDVLKKVKQLTIVHTGNFYQHRSSVKFIKSIIYLLENNLINKNEVLIKFIGVLDDEGKSLINSSEFKECFQLLGYIEHSESIREIKSADILLLIPGPGIGTMPGKFYEYLAAEKPIFCISNEGPPKKYINEFKLGVVSNDSKFEEVAKKMLELILLIKNNNFSYPNVSILKKKFNRKYIAKDMIEVFNSLNEFYE